MVNGCFENILSAENISTHGLHWMKFTGWHLLERRCMKNKVYVAHSMINTMLVTDIAKIELKFIALITLSHIILLFLVATKDSNLAN